MDDENIPEPALSQEFIIEEFRVIRDGLLNMSDRYMVIDFPITEDKRQEWKVYRQALRDLPTNTDLTQLKMNYRLELINFTWPTTPS